MAETDYEYLCDELVDLIHERLELAESDEDKSKIIEAVRFALSPRELRKRG